MTHISGVQVLSLPCYSDKRGYFSESFKPALLQAQGIHDKWVQDNLSYSYKGVLRGLHYQYQYPQAKLIQVLSGSIWDVVVDLREDSPSFGQWQGFELSAPQENTIGERVLTQLYVPIGCAHGFLTLSDSTVVSYKVSEHYHPEDEYTLLFSDAFLNIDWPLAQVGGVGALIVSDKDKLGQSWERVRKF